MFECHSGIRNLKKTKGPSIESVDEGYNEAFVSAAPIGLAAHGQARHRCRAAAQSGALASIRMSIAYIIGYTDVLSRTSTTQYGGWSWRRRALPSAYNARSPGPAPARASPSTLTKLIRRTTMTSPATVYVIRIVMNDSTNIMNSFIPHLSDNKFFIGCLTAYYFKVEQRSLN